MITPSDYQNIYPVLTNRMVTALTNDPNWPDKPQQEKAMAASYQIAAYEPEDGTELQLATHAAAMMAMMTDAVLDSRTAETPQQAYKHRQQVIALGRAHLAAIKDIRAHRIARAKARTAKNAAAAQQELAQQELAQQEPAQPELAQPEPAKPEATRPGTPPSPQPQPQPQPQAHSATGQNPARTLAVRTG